MSTLTLCALGQTPYRDGLRLQEALVRARADGETGDWLLFPDHPPVLTVGRSPSPGALLATPEELAAKGIELFEVARGGNITRHGPGQLVGYAIVDLTERGRDMHRWLRDLEEGLIRSLSALGIEGHRVKGRTGIWVAEAKIASIGVAVRRWVGYHGFALNVHPDLEFFNLIHPCGLKGIHMTSVAALLGKGAPALEQVRVTTAGLLAETLGYDATRWASPEEAWEVAGESIAVGAKASNPHAA